MPNELQKTDKQIRDEIVSKAMAKIRDPKSPTKPPRKDLVIEARELVAKATPGKWGYDLNGHVAVIEDDNEWGQTLFLIPGKTTPQMTSEDHANGELFARAPELLRQLCDEVERRDELIVHMYVHSGYRNNGYLQMTTPQKALYDGIWKRSVEELDKEESND